MYHQLMTKTSPKTKLNARDWIMVALALAIVATNVLWYLHVQALQLTDRNDATSWLAHQVEINKLKACIDSGSRPCDINPHIQQ